MPARFQKLGHAAKIVAPGVDSVPLDSVQAELDRVIEVERVSAHRAVAARAPGEPHVTVDGGGQHKAVVVVGVLSDQVDAPRRAHHHFGRRAEEPLEGLLNHRSSSRLEGSRQLAVGSVNPHSSHRPTILSTPALW